MIIPVTELRELAENVLTRQGLAPPDARIVADVLLEAELRGRITHGVVRLPAIARQISGKPQQTLKTVKQGLSYARVDGRENLGYLVAYQCARSAVTKAMETGVGVACGFNTGHCGMLGYYASQIAETGMVSLVMCDTSPCIVPAGGTQPVVGTNPIVAGFPSGGYPILVDFPTVAVTNGQIIMAIRNGTQIPEGCALGPDRNMATNPEAAMAGAVLPFGGHKGYALSVMIQILSGILTGAAAIPEPGGNYGIFMPALSPSIFLGPDRFQTGVDELIQRLKAAGVSNGMNILYPGERAFRERRHRLQNGIDVDKNLMGELAAL